MKRLRDCGLWSREWFRKLPGKQKLLLSYLWDVCDLTGVWDADFGLASFQIGQDVSPQDIDALNEAMGEPLIIEIGPQRFWLSEFVSLQYGRIGDQSKVHVSVFKRLVEHGLETQDCVPYASEDAVLRLRQAFGKSSASPKDKSKEISKEKDKGSCLLPVPASASRGDPECFRDPRKPFLHARGNNGDE